MRQYKLGKLIPGYKVKPSLRGKVLIAIPWKVTELTIVILKDANYRLDSGSPMLHKQTFDDKFGRDKTYVLHYYEYAEKDESTNQLNLF